MENDTPRKTQPDASGGSAQVPPIAHRHEHRHHSYLAIGEIAQIVQGLLLRARLSWLVEHYAPVPFLALFSCINGCISIGLITAIAFTTHSPFIFPSLGSTAFLCFYTPSEPSASPRNTIIGHVIGAVVGYLSLLVTRLPTTELAQVTLTWPRVIAAALSLGVTVGVMVLVHAPHPPGASSALMITLGILVRPLHIFYLLVAVVLLTLQAIVINRLAGVPYPLWSPRPQPVRSAGGREKSQ
jgi:CBS domain-containing membrane protein